MNENSNLPNREDKVRELKPDEREALIQALESELISLHTPAGVAARLILIGLAEWAKLPRGERCVRLTIAGHILAVELRKSDRLERAKEKLAEWESSTDDEWSSARLELSGSGPWLCELSVKGVDDSRAESDDPLTAVIEASKQTPWKLLE